MREGRLKIYKKQRYERVGILERSRVLCNAYVLYLEVSLGQEPYALCVSSILANSYTFVSRVH